MIDASTAFRLPSGTTAQRPTLTATDVGYTYFDTDLNARIDWNGTTWIAGASPITVLAHNGTAYVADTSVRVFIMRSGDPAPTGLNTNDIVITQT
jgi:hypothetical protein